MPGAWGRFLIDHGEIVVRLPPRLMTGVPKRPRPGRIGLQRAIHGNALAQVDCNSRALTVGLGNDAAADSRRANLANQAIGLMETQNPGPSCGA
jgi:hypothetical protein